MQRRFLDANLIPLITTVNIRNAIFFILHNNRDYTTCLMDDNDDDMQRTYVDQKSPNGPRICREGTGELWN
jgi:hypothetical protein